MIPTDPSYVQLYNVTFPPPPPYTFLLISRLKSSDPPPKNNTLGHRKNSIQFGNKKFFHSSIPYEFSTWTDIFFFGAKLLLPKEKKNVLLLCYFTADVEMQKKIIPSSLEIYKLSKTDRTDLNFMGRWF